MVERYSHAYSRLHESQLAASEVDDDEVAKVCVPVGEMLVTELNPGDAGFAPTFESVNYCGVQEFSRVPMVHMVEFDMADPDERRLQADVALQQERASRHIDAEGGINSSIGGGGDLFEFDFELEYRKGARMQIADCLSRNSQRDSEWREDDEEMPAGIIKSEDCLSPSLRLRC